MSLRGLIGLPARAWSNFNGRRQKVRWFDEAKLDEIHAHNLGTLADIPCWIEDDVWRSSVFQYGLPQEIRPLIDLPMGAGHSYTDAMLALAGRLRKPVRYLEVGVSVGKNFLQITRYLRDAWITGFDIEEINPVLRDQFTSESRTEWPTSPASIKKTPSSLTRFATTELGNSVSYLCGDVFDDASWQHLGGRRFNLVFSDAFHSAEALEREQEMLARHDLLDEDELVIVWDDLFGDMADGYQRICRRLSENRAGCTTSFFIAPFRGWLGENWGWHPVGFFISFRKHGTAS